MFFADDATLKFVGTNVEEMVENIHRDCDSILYVSLTLKNSNI